MKTNVLTIIAVVLSTTAVNAQKGELNLSLEGGLSAPIGNYGDDNSKSPKALFATNGPNYKFNLSYFVLNPLSIDLGVGYCGHGYDIASYENQYFKSHGNSFAYDLKPKSLEVVSAGYTNLSFMLGLGTRLNFTDKFFMSVKLQLGVNKFYDSGLQSTLYYDDPTPLKQREEVWISEASGNAFVNSYSAGFGFKFTSRFGAMVNFEMLDTKYEYKSAVTYEELDDDMTYVSAVGVATVNTKASWINLNVGVFFSLVKGKE